MAHAITPTAMSSGRIAPLTRTAGVLAVLFAMGLAGCRGKANAAADDQILWDSRGCAFYVRPHVGGTSIVRRLKGGDRPRCAPAVHRKDDAHG